MTQPGKKFDWPDYQRACGWCIDETPDEWFAVPYRSREEALVKAFGPHWVVTDVPVHADFVLPGILLTHPGNEFRVLTHFFEQRWYPTQNAPENLEPEQQPPLPRGRVRERRSALKDVIKYAVGSPRLSSLMRLYGMRATENTNQQASAYPPALFGVWLDEQSITGDEADALRMLVGLAGPSMSVDLIAATETNPKVA